MSARLNIAIDSWAFGARFAQPLNIITIGAYMLAENGLNEKQRGIAPPLCPGFQRRLNVDPPLASGRRK
jgi:hypothetical protein